MRGHEKDQMRVFFGGDPQMFITKVENLQVAQRLKHLPAMRETLVWSLGQENPLEKKMATHSSILAWIIPWMEEPGGLQSTGSQRVGHDWANSLTFNKSWPSEVSLLDGVSGASELWCFMSQHRKNSARSKVLEKKWLIRIGHLWGLQVDGWGDATSWKLSEVQFYNQWKSGKGEKIFFFLILE